MNHQETRAGIPFKHGEAIRPHSLNYDKRLTAKGIEAAKLHEGLPLPDAKQMPRETLHPKLRNGAWNDFIRGDYSGAIFKAFKEVEITLRSLSRLEYDGVTLAEQALKPEKGPLTDKNTKAGQQKAMMMLFAGAIGLCRNPNGHDNPEYEYERAAREFQLADLLLRILDETELASADRINH